MWVSMLSMWGCRVVVGYVLGIMLGWGVVGVWMGMFADWAVRAVLFYWRMVTVPGASEHQIGLALDIVCSTYMSLDEGFGDTEAGKWLAENSCRFGFILRYPKGKEYITGIEYEPWHFRYVGVKAAEVITKQGITLEEFWEEYLDNV